MTFLAPTLLAAAAAGALPVVIHLLNKTRVREVRWAAMQFLMAAQKTNERRLKVEDLLLLLVRILLVLLLVLAFARPALLGPPGAGGGGPTAVMIVLDHSLSMGFNDGTGTRLEAAKREALSLLDGLAPGSAAGLVLASDRADTVVPSPSEDLPLVRRRVELASQSARSADLFPAIQAAASGLRSSAHPRREVHIFTDDQAAAWARTAEVSTLVARESGLVFVHHPVGGRETSNLSITGISPAVAIPAVGESATVSVALRNSSGEEVQGVRVVIGSGTERPENEAVVERLAANGSATVVLNILVPATGWQTVTASLPPDRLPADNSRAFALRVPEEMQILFVGEPASFTTPLFLRHAMNPVGASPGGADYLRIEQATAPELAQKESLEPYSLIVLTSGGDLPEPARQKLEEWVVQGGSLLVFPGAEKTATPPGAVISGHSQPSDAPGVSFRLRSDRFNHPVTSLWNDSAAGGFSSVRFLRRAALQLPGEAKNPVALLEFEDGSPALMEYEAGQGRVVAAAFALDQAWGNLQLSPSFVPLVQRLTAHLLGDVGMTPPLSPGGTFRTSVPREFLGRKFLVRLPESEELTVGGVVEEAEGRAVVAYRETDLPGAYELYLEDQPAPRTPLAAFAVQSPPEAGLLQYAEESRVAAALHREEEKSVLNGAVAVESAPSVRAEFWFPLMVAVALLSLLELAMAHRFSLSK